MTLLSRKLLVPSRASRKPSLDLREATEGSTPGESFGNATEGSRHIRRFGVRVLEVAGSGEQSLDASDERVEDKASEIREAEALFGWGRKKKRDEDTATSQPAAVRSFGSEMVSEPEEIDDDFVPEPPVPEEERVVRDEGSREGHKDVVAPTEDAGCERRDASRRRTENETRQDRAPVEFFSEMVSDPVPLEEDDDNAGDSGECCQGDDGSDEVSEAQTSNSEETEAEPQGERASREPDEQDEMPDRAEEDDDEEEDDDGDEDEDRKDLLYGDSEPDDPEQWGIDDEERGRADMSARDAGPVGEQVGPETDLTEQAQSAIMTIEGNQAHALSASHGVPTGRRRRKADSARKVRPHDASEPGPIDVDKLAVTTVDMDWPDRRKSIRLRMSRVAGFAPLPKKLLEDLAISELPWRASSTINFSCGGALMELDEKFEVDDLLVLHLDMADLFFPPFSLGRVSFSQEMEDGRFRTGLMFITDENKDQYLPAETVERLPGEVLDYETNRSREIETTLVAWRRQSQLLESQEEDR